MWYFIMTMCVIMMYLLVLYLYRCRTYEVLKAEWEKEHEKELQECFKIIEKYEREENKMELMKQFENEDMAKELLFATKDKTAKEQELKVDLLNGILEKRENLYIYPEKANV